ncbi:MAG: YHYH protein, partial [Psychroserpens sp.]|nr:YHYH protein [Psychroserpens sp.]
QIYIDDGGYYGSDVLNFQKNPKITAQVGSGARLKPIVIDGKVTGVQIFNRGINYPDNPDVLVIDSSGSGQGAILRAVVVDGTIDEVVIISEGISYDPNTTDIEVIDPARDAILTPRIRNLEVNLQERFGFESLINNSYAIVSYARTIREDVYNDIGLIHSPIIGWANDGNPIYGGFAYDNPEDPNSEIRAMSTAYVLDADAVFGRPSLTKYPAGFFVEDYQYTGEGDLDEYNGRYARTPEFPNGVYAYFAGISTEIDLERAPQFPYFIGPEYRDAPINTPDIDQDFNLNDKPIYRNTFPYYVGSPVAGSEFLVQSYLSDIQDSIIESVNPGKVTSIAIVGAGASYRVGDLPIFENEEGILSSVVSEVEGKEVISIASSQTSYNKSETKIIRLNNNFVRVYVEPTHDYLNQDLVVLSGLTTSLSVLEGPSRVFVDTRNMTLASVIPPSVIETVEDIFVNSLNETVAPGALITIGAPDNTETVEVLNVFPNNRGLRIYRSNATGFGQSHLIGESIDVIPYYFDIKATTEDFQSEIDELYYFNPQQTVGFGTTPGQEVPVEYFIGDVKFDLSLPTQTIFAPSHKFRNNELITLSKASS